MKIIQIIACGTDLVALTDTGDLFVADSKWESWNKLKLPTQFDPHKDYEEEHEAFDEVQAKKESRALDSQREIDLASLPPKLASLASNDTPANMCPDCGMPWNGINCQECNI